jgi:uncharacterized paraquat-inducible protein A
MSPRELHGCHTCGLVQALPAVPPGHEAVCRRCGTPFARCRPWLNRLAAATAAAALALYLPAVTLPLLRVEKLGYLKEDSLLSGVGSLYAEGYWTVAAVVLLFSVVLPPLKLLALSLLADGGWLRRHRSRAVLYRAVEALGRWGMLDVMLVAILVAYIKLGDLVSISAGPGLLAFTAMVLLSLLASLLFHPHCLWEDPF